MDPPVPELQPRTAQRSLLRRVQELPLRAAAASSTASGTASADDAGTLHIAWTADSQTLDVQTTSADYGIPMNVYDRLFEIKLNDDGSTQLVNSLVKDYTVSDDGLTYQFTLRDDVKFSDGTPLTANDVASLSHSSAGP